MEVTSTSQHCMKRSRAKMWPFWHGLSKGRSPQLVRFWRFSSASEFATSVFAIPVVCSIMWQLSDLHCADGKQHRTTFHSWQLAHPLFYPRAQSTLPSKFVVLINKIVIPHLLSRIRPQVSQRHGGRIRPRRSPDTRKRCRSNCR